MYQIYPKTARLPVRVQKIITEDSNSGYQFFENVVEKCVDSCASVWIKLRSQSEDILFCMEIESEANLACFSEMAQSCTCEDGIWRFVFTVEKAGES